MGRTGYFCLFKQPKINYAFDKNNWTTTFEHNTPFQQHCSKNKGIDSLNWVTTQPRGGLIVLRIYWEIQQSGFEQKPRELWSKKKCKTPTPINIKESGRTSDCYSIINLLEIGNAAENSTLAAVQTALAQQEIEALFCGSRCRRERKGGRRTHESSLHRLFFPF